MNSIADRTWPAGFVWGAATSSYQIEGDRTGRGLSVWDAFCRRRGAIYEGHTGDRACDHIRRWREDVASMRQIGLHAYRFSISWPRILPRGVGRVHARGLDFYDRLVDALLEASIEPWITLFHWDFPLALYRRGGWLNPDSAHWFADYARCVAARLSDRVSHWMTLNEPQCFMDLGHIVARHAPGDKFSMQKALRASHHVLLAHGRAVEALRSCASRPLRIGLANAAHTFIPYDEGREQDRRAALAAMASLRPGSTWNNTLWNDPIFFGRYPAQILRVYKVARFEPSEADLRVISQPLDFVGLNVYSGRWVRASANGRWKEVPFPPGYPLTHFNWPVTPRCIYWAAKFYFERYRVPVVITENGLSLSDWVAQDGAVHDAARIDFLDRYLAALHDAIRDGIDIRGYFYWSLLDNFEWAEGYKERFGLIHVDFSTGTRTLKDSAYWYRDQIAHFSGRKS